MRGIRPIPRRLLPQSMIVHIPTEGGGFAEGIAVGNVRFDRKQSLVFDEHRSADGGLGTVFVDAVNSVGAFDIPAGSRITIDNCDLIVTTSKRLHTMNGTVHHWELVVQ